MNCTDQKRMVSDPGLPPTSGSRISGIGFQFKMLLFGLVVALALQPAPLRACAACYGQSDSPMAQGMNWGIMSLLVVVGTVLGGVAAFFVDLARRAATAAAEPSVASLRESTNPIL